MAKRRADSGEQVSLFPFLSILACLIGALIMIIVVLCVSQTQQSDGRTPEELQQAREYQDLLKKEKLQKDILAELKVKQEELEKVKKDQQEKQERIAKLRMLLDSSADIKKMNAEISQNLLKELDDLLLEITGLTRTQTETKKEIALLEAELKKREIPKDKVVPPVMVQPGGSGLAKGAKVFFVEASGGKIVMYWDAEKRTQISAAAEVIVADPVYNHFLKAVKEVPDAKIIFLLRSDGTGAFNNAAGWAQATYEYKVSQIGKLLIPGQGDIDLKMFSEFLGTLAPPADAKLMPPPKPAQS
jgi:hypothetical protein